MTDINELYVDHLNLLGNGKIVELVGTDVTGSHQDNSLTVFTDKIVTIRKNILANVNLYKLNIFLMGGEIINLKFDDEQLFTKAYNQFVS